MERIFMNQFCEFQAVLSFRIIWIFLMYDERRETRGAAFSSQRAFYTGEACTTILVKDWRSSWKYASNARDKSFWETRLRIKILVLNVCKWPSWAYSYSEASTRAQQVLTSDQLFGNILFGLRIEKPRLTFFPFFMTMPLFQGRKTEKRNLFRLQKSFISFYIAIENFYKRHQSWNEFHFILSRRF